MNLIDFIGYIASVFVVGSFLLRDLRKVRIVNFCGCACFVIYGIGKGMLLPIIIPNAILACIQIFFLAQDWKKSQATSSASTN